jgi:hypothetical protein
VVTGIHLISYVIPYWTFQVLLFLIIIGNINTCREIYVVRLFKKLILLQIILKLTRFGLNIAIPKYTLLDFRFSLAISRVCATDKKNVGGGEVIRPTSLV